MVGYRLMDARFVVPVCLGPLASGPLALSSIDQLHRKTPFEEQFALPSGNHSPALKKLVELYGATGMAAIDDRLIVGLIRFCPAQIKDLLGGYLCIQEELGFEDFEDGDDYEEIEERNARPENQRQRDLVAYFESKKKLSRKDFESYSDEYANPSIDPLNP